MTTAEVVLGGICVGVASGLFGSLVSGRKISKEVEHKVNCSSCLERRDSCTKLMSTKFKSLEDKLDILIKKLGKNGFLI